jgi:hemerythrin-like domain-containing protein
MSTESPRKDHHLIDKMLTVLDAAAGLLKSYRAMPSPILDQVIDFTKKFLMVCLHDKEEKSLFPTLEESWMQRKGGPIAKMHFEHELTKQLGARLKEFTKEYLSPVSLLRNLRTSRVRATMWHCISQKRTIICS